MHFLKLFLLFLFKNIGNCYNWNGWNNKWKSGFLFLWKKKVEDMIVALRIKILQRCKKFLKQHGRTGVDKILFSDEKLFWKEQSNIARNDVIFSATFEDKPTGKYFQNKNSIMICTAVINNEKWLMKFIDTGIKINAYYHKKKILATNI